MKSHTWKYYKTPHTCVGSRGFHQSFHGLYPIPIFSLSRTCPHGQFSNGIQACTETQTAKLVRLAPRVVHLPWLLGCFFLRSLADTSPVTKYWLTLEPWICFLPLMPVNPRLFILPSSTFSSSCLPLTLAMVGERWWVWGIIYFSASEHCLPLYLYLWTHTHSKTKTNTKL